MEGEDEGPAVENNVYIYERTALCVLLLKALIEQKPGTGEQKLCTAILGQAKLSFFKTLKQIAVTELKLSTRSKDLWQ